MVGLLATLGRGTGALVTTACGDGLGLCDDEGSEGQNGQEEGSCADEHDVDQTIVLVKGLDKLQKLEIPRRDSSLEKTSEFRQQVFYTFLLSLR